MDVKYLTSAEIATQWGISERSVRNYCNAGRVDGAVLIGKIWQIPADAKKPNRINGHNESLLDVLRMQKFTGLKGGIYHKLQVELTYNSNHIEGSKLTHDQTRYIYETNTIGTEEKAISIDDLLETVNHFRCIDYVLDIATQQLTEKQIKELHRILKNDGEYKKNPNIVGGIETTSPKNVQKEIKKLLDEYNETEFKSFEDLIEFHVNFERIHPFQDGNGRVGRLILLKECLKYNYVPFIIDDDFKLFYYRGLKEWSNEHGYLLDTCRASQDKFKTYLDYFEIPYKSDARIKLEKTIRDVAENGKIALAFSGGVDSSILLEVAKLAGIDVLLLEFDLNESLKLPEVYNNQKDRCYYCKSLMMKTLKEKATSQGYNVLCDGTNADDLKEYRPGLRALEEQEVKSPIALSGITKAELREIGKELGLPVASKPSSPCHLTRFPYDTHVTSEMLVAVKDAEQVLKNKGFDACRVRVFGKESKIEVPIADIPKLKKNKVIIKNIEDILYAIGVECVCIDEKGLRSGTMDEKENLNG